MCWHKWGKWEQEFVIVEKPLRLEIPIGQYYSGPATVEFSELWQKCQCQKCLKVKMEFIR